MLGLSRGKAYWGPWADNANAGTFSELLKVKLVPWTFPGSKALLHNCLSVLATELSNYAMLLLALKADQYVVLHKATMLHYCCSRISTWVVAKAQLITVLLETCRAPFCLLLVHDLLALMQACSTASARLI